MKKKERIASANRTYGMIALVNEYSQLLKIHLDGGQEKPDPQDYMDRYARKGRQNELRMHLNLATILTVDGCIQRQEAQKVLRSGRRSIEKSKQRFFDQLLKREQ